ncbi:hypothetical protein TARUN_8404 [Trichoderma arundinaceum]|uniref:Uncharacterized protein n=1 Tax=Trichoderma arundinaceum TaxID=490622 RepID=A0A395ND03_TRIAR|nr:hypothetical protein TARUN_8404 [Trichoderma arundinaceum]
MAATTENKATIEALESFPTLQPAFVIQCGIAGQYPCGDIYTGSSLVGVPLSWGTLKSVPGFEPKLDLKLSHGHDWFRVDNDKTHARLSVSAIISDAENRSIRLTANGVSELNEQIMALITGSPDAKTPPFGFGVEQMTIESGHDVYKPLEGMMFACSQRFALGENGEPLAEIRVSRIVSGTGNE